MSANWTCLDNTEPVRPKFEIGYWILPCNLSPAAEQVDASPPATPPIGKFPKQRIPLPIHFQYLCTPCYSTSNFSFQIDGRRRSPFATRQTGSANLPQGKVAARLLKQASAWGSLCPEESAVYIQSTQPEIHGVEAGAGCENPTSSQFV